MSFRARIVPLNPVDKTLLALDAGNDRIVFHLVLYVLGEIEPPRMHEAICSAMQAHPTVKSVLRMRRFSCCREELTEFGGEMLTVCDVDGSREGNGVPLSDHEAAIRQWINRPMNLKENPPVRVLLLRGKPQECTLIFTFHHSAADGLRALRFIREVIARYNGEGLTHLPAAEDTCSCHRRDEVLSLVQTWKERTKHFYFRLFRQLFHRFVLAALPPPERLFHDKCGSSSSDVFFLHRTLRSSQVSQFGSRPGTSGLSVNDRLLACCFSAVDRWNQMHGRTSRKISLMVPVDVGRRSSANVISNQVTYISPSTTRRERADPYALIARTAAARAGLLRDGNHLSIIYFTYFISFVPLPLLRALARIFVLTRIYVDSILLTNLGLIWPWPYRDEGQTKLGNAVLTAITGAVPVIAPFRMGLLATTYNGTLDISLTYRTCLVSVEKAQAFLDLYVEQLLSSRAP